jgi:hypothetical protein
MLVSGLASSAPSMRFTLALLLPAVALCIPAPPSTRDAPFIETFRRQGKTLIYVLAVHHSSVQYPNPMSDPAFKTIERVFLSTPPDAVIIEGVDPSQIAAFCEHTVRPCGSAHYNIPGKACEENTVASYSAIRLGVPVYTGEPSASRQLAVFQAHGYTIQDFLAFWILNNIPQEKRRGPFSEERFRQLVERVVGYENHLLGTSVRFNPEDFANWYAKNMPIPRSYLDLDPEDTSPYPPPQSPKTLLHTLSALSTEGRDESVLDTIKTVLKGHNRVLVVYGASHLDSEWAGLVELMGVPKKTKPF